MSKIDSTNGVWIHATSLVTIGIPVKHEFSSAGSEHRWRIQIEGQGEIELRFVDGTAETFVVKPGDTLVAVEDHVYASLQVTPGTPPGALAGAARDQQASV